MENAVITSAHSIPKYHGGGFKVYLEGGKRRVFTPAQADKVIFPALRAVLAQGKEEDAPEAPAKKGKK